MACDILERSAGVETAIVMGGPALVHPVRAETPRLPPESESTEFVPRDSDAPNMYISAAKVLVPCLLLVTGLSAGAQESATSWSPERLRTVGAWPHGAADGRIEPTKRGLVVGVADGRRFAIAAANGLTLPAHFGRVRVVVTELGNGATWIVRLYGDLRRREEVRTASIAEGQDGTGEHVFEIDPRIRTLTDVATQLQIGVEGPPGAFVVFEDVAFLPPKPRPNCRPSVRAQSGQRDIATVELMPNLPDPFNPTDWRAKARDFDKLAFDFQARGRYLPLVWLDNSHVNVDRPAFGLPSYVGGARQDGGQEGVTCLGAVLGATLVGIDKARQDHDYVAMCEAWFNARNGLDLVLNLQRQETGGSFWYEIWPNIEFAMLADRYPDHPRLAEIARIGADRWRQACLDLADRRGVPDFRHTAYNFRTRKPVDNGRWIEPDGAAGVAWIEYAAWKKSGNVDHLIAAEGCLRFLQEQATNPYYEVLLPYGALTAVRANAELGRTYDADRMLDWCFGISDCRGGWGVTVGRWGGHDCDGLLGGIDNRGGYAFAMNTFAQAGALVPVARYDPRYARALGKWMLNLTNAAGLFYPGALPLGHESSADWSGDPLHVIAYEGLRREWRGKSPFATGDPVVMNWGPKTDLGIYGSAIVGVLGAIVRTTDDPHILQLDCLASDFYRDRAYPTSLCYNPHDEPRRVKLAIGTGPSDLYDAVRDEFACRNAKDTAVIQIPADSAVVLVIAPTGGRITRDGERTRINGVAVSYRRPGA